MSGAFGVIYVYMKWLTKTSPVAISPQLFHSKLKTLLFNKSYPDSSSSSYLLRVSTL